MFGVPLKADHFWYVNSLTIVENPVGSGQYDIEYTFTVNFQTVKRFYWELFVVESGCTFGDGFTESFTGCTLLGDLPDGDFAGTLAEGIRLCPGKTYDAILYTRRRGDCTTDDTGGSGGTNVPNCDGPVNCSDMTCGCPEDRADAATPLGLLTKFPNIAAGDPANIWAGSPLNSLGDTPNFDGNWAYLRTTLTGNGLPDYNISFDIEFDDCFGDFDASASFDQADGQVVNEDLGSATVRCGAPIFVTYNAMNNCGVGFPGNTFEIFDNSTIGSNDLGSNNFNLPMGPGTNIDGRFEDLNNARAIGKVCQDGTLSLNMLNAACASETTTDVTVTMDVEILYPTSNFAAPMRVNCSDMCGQDLILSSGAQWNSTGLNMGTATTLEIDDASDNFYSFDWSGQVCTPSITPTDCDEGSGSVMVDNCASCGTYDITYAIVNDSCGTCSTTTTREVEIVSPRIANVTPDITACGVISPSITFDVVECNPATGAATATPYTGVGDRMWERSDNPGVFIPFNAPGTVAAGETVTFTPHWRFEGCASCNAVGAPITVTSIGILEVTCPADTDLGTFDCSNLATIPAAPTTQAMAEAAPYSIVFGADPCGTIVVTSSDDMVPDVCTAADQVITRTITIIDDEDGNGMLNGSEQSETCSFTFTIEPGFDAPALVGAPGDVSISCESPPAPTTLNYTNAGTNACLSQGMVTSTLSAYPGICGGTVTETWTIPSSANCNRGDIVTTRIITILEPDPPSITCPSNQNVACAADISPGMATATTSCGATVNITNTTPMLTSGQADCPGATYQITYTATDECGGSVSCTQTFTIVNNPPTITCPVNATVMCAADITIGTPTVTTSCTLGNTVTTSGPTLMSGTADCPGAIYHVVYTTEDDCGRTAMCTQVFTIANAAPTITCPVDETVMCAADITAGTPSFTVSCTLGTTVSNTAPMLTSGDADCPGAVYTITYTVMDGCGRTATCDQEFTIANPIPTITCPADATVMCLSDITIGTPTVTTSCGLGSSVSTMGPTLASGDANCPGATYEVVYTVEDNCGRTASCTQIFTIANDPPEITAPSDAIVECASDIAVGTPTAMVSCDLGSSVTTEGPTLLTGTANCPMSTYEIKYIVADACDRRDTAIQIFTIANDPPTITCPGDMTVDCMADIVIGVPTTTTSCGLGSSVRTSGPTLVSGDDDCPGAVYQVTYTVEDDCGRTASCNQNFTIANDGPMITCPADATVTCFSDVLAGTASATSSCSLGLTAITNTAPALVSGDDGCDGAQYEIMYSVTDDCGRTATCTQTFTLDNNGPSITACPGNQVIICQADIMANVAGVTFTTDCGLGGTVMDGPIVANPGNSSCGELDGDSYSITYTVTDDCGRTATCTQTFTVNSSAPDISCAPELLIVGCDASDAPAPDPSIITGSDDCGMISASFVSDVPSGGGCPGDTLVILRTYRVTNACGVTTDCTQEIKIFDNVQPSITIDVPMVAVSCETEPPLPTVTATDNCTATDDLTIDFSQDTTSMICPGNLMIVRTWIATDECGNKDTVTQEVGIFDDTNPTFLNVPADTTISCLDMIPPPADPTVDENCGVQMPDFSETTAAGSCPGESIITRTWSVEDSCMNMVSFTQTITVIDTVPPSITCPMDLNIVGCDTGDAPAPDITIVTASDGCSNVTITHEGDVSSGMGCGGDPLVIMRTYRATDQCGNFSECVQMISIIDNVAPTMVTCPADIVLTGCDISAAPTPDPSLITATDNCVTPVYSFVGDTPVGTVCPGDTIVITRIYRATDACGNFTDCTQLIKIVDDVLPVITSCPMDMTVRCFADIPAAAPSDVIATDNCGVPMPATVINTMNNGGAGCMSDPYTVTYTYQVLDGCNNAITCTQTITVIDDAVPVITDFPSDVTVQCPADVPAPNPSAIVATDNCGIETVAVISMVDNSAADCAINPYTVVYTYEVQDSCGNSDTHIQTITVEDITPPTLSATPGPMTVSCLADVPGAQGISATDNCADVGTVMFEQSMPGTCPGDDAIINTWTVEDCVGNITTHMQIITIEDNMPPALSATPPNVTVTCLSDVPGDPGITATDNCGETLTVTYTQSNPGACPGDDSITNTWSVTDCAGNNTIYVQTVTIEDNVPPSLSAMPGPMTVNCLSDVPGDPGITATDNCGEALNVTFSQSTPGACPGDDTITNTWMVTDCAGNITTHTQTIAIDDNIPPVFSLMPADIIVTCISDVPGDAGVGATDNCGEALTVGFTQSSAGACPGDDVITNTWTVTDCAGNMISYTQTVTIDDNIAPVLSSTPANITVSCLADVPGDPGITATDNCGEALVVDYMQSAPGACPGDDTITNTWTVTDCANNTTTYTQTVTIVDVTPPSFTMTPPDVTVTCLADVPGDPGVMATDNCGEMLTVVFEQSMPGACPGSDVITNTWTVEDCAGNMSMYTQTVTIDDNIAPVLSSMPADITVSCLTDVPGDPGVTATDNCGETLTVVFSQSSSGLCPGNDVITNSWTVIDCAGNTTIHTQMVTIMDVTAPVFSATPDNLTVTCFDDVPGDPGVTATDNCGENLTVTFVQSMPGTCDGNDIITNTWSVMDCAGNVTSHTQTITIIDNVTPVIPLDEGSTVTCILNAILPPIPPNVIDNCGSEIVPVGPVISPDPTCPGVGIKTFEWTYTDCAGNSDTYTFTYTINDIAPPAFDTLPPDITINCEDPIPVAPLVQGIDACEGVLPTTFTEVIDGTMDSCPNDFTITRTWEVEDCAGNMNSHTQVITVEDNEAPQITCPADVILIGCNTAVAPLVDINTVTATDNCGTPTVSFVSDIVMGSGCIGDTIVILRTYRATDDCGQSTDCIQTIKIVDDVPPVVTGIQDITVACEADIFGLFGTWVNNNGGGTATDNCNFVTWSTIPPNPVLTNTSGETCVTFIATDRCGNQTSQEACFNINCSSLTKTFTNNQDGDGSTDVSVGDVLEYRIVYTNEGSTVLNNVSVTDNILTPASMSCPILVPGDSCVLVGTYTVSDSDMITGAIINVATGDSDETTPITDDITIPVPTSLVDMEKQAPTLLSDIDGSGDMSVGDIIQYTIIATNTGDANLTDVVIDDPLLSPSMMMCPILAAGEQCVLTGTYTILPTDLAIGSIKNNATVNTTQTFPPLMDSVEILLAQPNLTIVKGTPINSDSDNSLDISFGDTLTYTITATNTGDAALTNVVITDNTIDKVGGSSPCAILLPGESCTFIGTYVITLADIDLGQVVEITNVATVSSDQLPDISDDTTIEVPNPSMEINKSAGILTGDLDGSGDISLFDEVTYTTTITNNGNANLSMVSIQDPFITPSSAFCELLVPGQQCILVGVRVITPDDLANGSFTNRVTGISTIPPLDAMDTSMIIIPTPNHTMRKSAPILLEDNDQSLDISEGDVLQYTITATNTGTANLTNVTISDPLLSPSSTVCPLLPVGETCELVGTYTIMVSDLGDTLINTAGSITDQTDVLTDMHMQGVPFPELEIDKSEGALLNDNDGNGLITAGDLLEYEVILTNIGTANLTNVTVEDDLITPSSENCAFLGPNETCTLIGTYLVTQDDMDRGSISNTAFGNSDQAPPVVDNTFTITPFIPELQLDKSVRNISLTAGPNDDQIDPGDTIYYQYIVTNTGLVTMSDIEVDDLGPTFNSTPGTNQLSAITCDITTLLPQEFATCMATYVISQTDFDNAVGVVDGIENNALTTGVDPRNDTFTSVPDIAIDSIPASPEIEILKTVGEIMDTNDDGILWVGDEVIYTFVVNNIGNTILNDVVITDDIVDSISCPLTTLAPGESMTCTGIYTLTRPDGDRLEVINQATAEGTDQTGKMVSDISDDPTVPTSSTSDPTVLVIPCPSVSCRAEINLSLAPTESLTLSPEDVGLPRGFLLRLRDENNNTLVENVIDCSLSGFTLIYEINHPCNPSTCWGRVNIETKGQPETTSTFHSLECGTELPRLITIPELQVDIANRGCFGPLDTYAENTFQSGEGCTGDTIVRNITANYAVDNVKQNILLHTDTIVFTPVALDDIVCPKSEDFDDALKIDCEYLSIYPDLTPDDIFEITDDIMSAYPYVLTGRQNVVTDTFDVIDRIITTTRDTTIAVDGILVVIKIIDVDTVFRDSIVTNISEILAPIRPGTTCNLSLKYEDEEFAGCLGERTKILRSWLILDWCTGMQDTCEQWIIIDDSEAPKIKEGEELEDLFVSISPWTCSAEVELELPAIMDNCSEWTYTWSSTAGVVEGDVISELWTDDSPVTVTLRVIDECDNVLEDEFDIYVIDNIAPVAISTDRVNVSLAKDPVSNLGLAKVFADEINEDSHDSDCGDISFCVLLDEELQMPIIRDGVHLSDDDGHLLYHPLQCSIDGTYLYEYQDDKITRTEEIPYVICKEFVKFCCDDVGEQRVALVVSDESPYSADGISWSIVNVEDKSRPVVVCDDIETQCLDSYHPDILGYPMVFDAVCDNGTLTFMDEGEVDGCGEGVILRTWLVDGLAECIQRIVVTTQSTFDPYEIKWPKHYTGEIEQGVRRECELWRDDEGDPILDDDGNEQYRIVEYREDIAMGDPYTCQVEENLATPVWCIEACNIIASSFEPIELEASDACKKIVRRWTLVDWCTWDENSNNSDDDNDTSLDTFEAVDDEWLDAVSPEDAGRWLTSYAERSADPIFNYPDGPLVTDLLCETCPKSSLPADHVYFRYRAVDIDGYYTFDQVIKVIDETPPTIDAPTSVNIEVLDGATSKEDDFDDCVGSDLIVASANDLCRDIAVDDQDIRWSVLVLGETGRTLAGPLELRGDTIQIDPGSDTHGATRTIIWTVTDGCGNTTTANTRVDYVDTKAPTPICIESLSTVVMSTNGTAVVWAEDYNRGSFDNCSEVEMFFKNEDGQFVRAIDLSCSDIPNGISTTLILELYAVDRAGNSDFCNISLRIDDNEDACLDTSVSSASISGRVNTPKGEVIQGVKISANDLVASITNEDGRYAFESLPMYDDYSIQGTKSDDYDSGITSIDLVLIQSHILGDQIITNPYELIAADVNMDEQISITDVIEIRRLLLGQINEFSSNRSWVFLDHDIDDQLKDQVWPFVEGMTIRDLSTNMVDQDLVGIKLGDVNGSIELDNDKRALPKLVLEMRDRSYSQGDQISLRLDQPKDIELVALQLGLNTRDLLPLSNTLAQDHVHYEENIFRIVTFDAEKKLNLEDQILEFTAMKDGLLSDYISLNSEIPSLAYSKTGVEFELELNILSDELEGARLLQNIPNPFKRETSIGFYLPDAGEVRFEFFDVSGRLVKELEATYSQGNHELSLTHRDFNGAGIIQYRMTYVDAVLTRGMVLLN